jgi:hypothetical protein
MAVGETPKKNVETELQGIRIRPESLNTLRRVCEGLKTQPNPAKQIEVLAWAIEALGDYFDRLPDVQAVREMDQGTYSLAVRKPRFRLQPLATLEIVF